MPALLRYQPTEKGHRQISASQFGLQIALYQEFLLNDFLLDRLPNCASPNTRQDLIDTARKMLDSILVLCANRDKMTNHTCSFVWVVSTPSSLYV